MCSFIDSDKTEGRCLKQNRQERVYLQNIEKIQFFLLRDEFFSLKKLVLGDKLTGNKTIFSQGSYEFLKKNRKRKKKKVMIVEKD